jgi:hypothetical protein
MLEIETARSRHTHIEDQAAWPLGKLGCQQLTRRGETHDVEPDRQDEFAKRAANILVIVDD